MDLKPDRSGARVGSIYIVGGLSAIRPDLEAVAALARTRRVFHSPSFRRVATPLPRLSRLDKPGRTLCLK